MSEPEGCDTFWSSHGCDLPRGHEGNHQCLDEEDGTVCSQPTPDWHQFGDDSDCRCFECVGA